MSSEQSMDSNIVRLDITTTKNRVKKTKKILTCINTFFQFKLSRMYHIENFKTNLIFKTQ